MRLLEITLEPATSLAGEQFDRLSEHLASEIDRAHLCTAVGEQYRPQYFSRPVATPAQLQESLNRLTDEIRLGRFPGNRASVRHAAQNLAPVAQAGLQRDLPQPLSQALVDVSDALRGYGAATARVREQLLRFPSQRSSCAQAAISAERALLGAFDDVAALFNASGARGLGF